MPVILRRHVIKRCPYMPETDAGLLTITMPDEAPELHGLGGRLSEDFAAGRLVGELAAYRKMRGRMEELEI